MEKIGRPSIEEEGTSIELGEPVLNEEFAKESIEATFPVIKEALDEFYTRRANREQQAAFALQVMRDAERPYTSAVAELGKEKGKVLLALAIFESVRGELQYERGLFDAYELESEDTEKNQQVEIKRQENFEKDAHYQEAADVLFSHDEYDVPERADFIEWLGETKGFIKKLASEEEEKFRGTAEGEGVGQRIFRSRLLTDVPAIERFETGSETTRDYREMMDLVESRLLAERERIGTVLLQYVNDQKTEFLHEMAAALTATRSMELFLSMLEGERNERIAKRQP